MRASKRQPRCRVPHQRSKGKVLAKAYVARRVCQDFGYLAETMWLGLHMAIVARIDSNTFSGRNFAAFVSVQRACLHILGSDSCRSPHPKLVVLSFRDRDVRSGFTGVPV